MSKLVETATLVTEVIGDTKTLFELEIKLLQAEVRELGSVSKQFVLLGALAIAALVPAVFFLGLALRDALLSVTTLPSWGGNLIVFLVMVGTSLIPLRKAMRLIELRKSGNS